MVVFKLEHELYYAKAKCKENQFHVEKANNRNFFNNRRDIV